MSNGTHTVKIAADTAEVEASLERCVELAERFRDLWGDSPLPAAIQRLEFNPGDRVVLRYDEALDDKELVQLKAQVRAVLPGVEPMVLTGGLHLEGVLADASEQEA